MKTLEVLNYVFAIIWIALAVFVVMDTRTTVLLCTFTVIHLIMGLLITVLRAIK